MHTPEAKRPRSNSSPNSGASVEGVLMGSERVGNMTQGQLMTMLMAGLSDLLDQKQKHLATKEDMKMLSSKIVRLEEENSSLKEEIKKLRDQEKVTHNKLLDLESRSRRNNLIFKGLQWAGKFPDYRRVVRQFCSEVLGASDDVWVNRAHPLGKNSNAIIAHLPNDSDINYIMTQAQQKLKGTDYFVHRDFPQEVREKRRCLMAVRSEVERVAGRRHSRLYHDHLILDGCRMTWDDGRLMAGQQDGAKKLTSMFSHDFNEFLMSITQPRPRKGQTQPAPVEDAASGTSGMQSARKTQDV